MGCANSKGKDPYSFILQKQGNETVQQFIVAYSKVHFIESSKNQMFNTIQQKIDSLKPTLLGKIQALKLQIDKRYKNSIQRIERSNPKAIMTAQKVFKGRLEELMGYQDVVRKLNDYKQQCKISIQREESHTLSYLKNYIKQYEAELRQKIPEIRKFQSLDEDQQEKFIKQAKHKHKSSIQKGFSQVQNVIYEKFHFDNFEPKFQSIVSQQKLNEIVSYGEKCFMAGEEKVKGATDCKTC